MKVVVDTREQKPWWVRGVESKALSVGDYTTTELEGVFHVERKSPGDLYGSILGGHSRFKKEILRAKEQGVELVILTECLEKDFYAKKWEGSWRAKVKGFVLAKIVAGIKRNHGVEFLWADGRVAAKRLCKELFRERSS